MTVRHKTDEKSLLQAKIEDAVSFSIHKNKIHFVGFLNEQEAQMACNIAQQAHFSNFALWGGYENAERVFFGAFPDFMDPDVSLFPIRSFTAVFRACDTLTHRDFLGAFMALGIERSTLGDFLLEQGRCVFFAKEEMGDFILSQITKVGKVGVRLQADFSLPLPAERKFQEFNSVIASPRLDCVVAAATGLSRERARGAITGGLVSLNHEEISNSSKEVKPGDKISFRGKGRFVIDQVGPLTKKGRLLLKGRKYI